MKFDKLNCLIRETPPPGCYGDSLAETARYEILREFPALSLSQFQTPLGFVRHPLSPWREDDTSSDQMLPYVLATAMKGNFTPVGWYRIPGTKTLVSPGLWFACRGHWRMLNLVNIVQGWILKFPYRIGDGFKIEKSDGQVQDYLNMVCIWVFLKRMNKWATLPRPADECMKAVRKYYLEGGDIEPNAEWLVELYAKALGQA